MTVKVAHEVLRRRSAEGSAGIDVAYQHPLPVDFHQVGALPHATVIAVFLAKGTLIFPIGQVTRRIDAHFLSSGKNQVPAVGIAVPESIGVTEVGYIARQNGIAVILVECDTVVVRYRHRLRLVLTSCGVESNHFIATGHTGTREDGSHRIRLNSDRLSLPVDKVSRSGVSPRHVFPL